MNTRFGLLGVLCLWVGLVGQSDCSAQPAPYPFKDPAQVRREAQAISDSLLTYIQRWAAGRAPSRIPDRLIPAGITDNKSFYLKRPQEVTARQTWQVRYAKPINLDSTYGGLPDPHATYLLLATPLAPFGSKLIVEGAFPHARFFAMQISPSLSGVQYTAQRVYGDAEVALVDADIEPLPGHVNPYRPGAERRAVRRGYRAEFNLAIGNPVSLNGSAHQPLYRGAGNRRTGAMLTYQGAYGSRNLLGFPINGGEWNVGTFWVRIYAPDTGTGPLGGVDMPKVWFELPDGQPFVIVSDDSVGRTNADATTPAPVTNTRPYDSDGPNAGWQKSWGIVRNVWGAVARINGWNTPVLKRQTRELDLSVTGRGADQPAPGNYEPHATTNNYTTYLGRGMTVEPGMVAVLTGRMPTFPHTRDGVGTMPTAECRYWSISGYYTDLFRARGEAHHSVMDDEVVLRANRQYMIVYSRPEDRPANATTQNGVTWVNWGPSTHLSLLLRWTSVGPEWASARSPHERHLTWHQTDWALPSYDSTLLGLNHHRGFLGCYQPQVHYLSKQAFEALKAGFTPVDIPIWINDRYQVGLSDARRRPVTASSANDPVTDPATHAVDGDLNTAWATPSSDQPQWLTVDLGAKKPISGVKLFWKSFVPATAYQIQVSDDNANWQTVFSTTTGDGEIDVINNLTVSGRYVRLYLTRWLIFPVYYLRELEVFTPSLPCATGSARLPANESTTRPPSFPLFPNPARESVTVDLRALLETLPAATRLNLLLFNATGAVVYRTTTSSRLPVLSTARLPAGTYTVVVEVNDRRFSERLVKE